MDGGGELEMGVETEEMSGVGLYQWQDDGARYRWMINYLGMGHERDLNHIHVDV